MKKFTATGLIAFVLMAGFGCDSANKPEDSVEVAEEINEERMDQPGVAEKDDQAEFMVKAASGGMMEVVLGKMAANQASHADVKAFGKMMVTDHTKVNEELKALAASKNITLPDRVGEDHQEHVDRIAEKRGTDFDKEYMSLMVEDHEEDVEYFREAANDNDYDDDVKAFASKTLTALEKHLQRAKEVNELVKNK